MRQLSDEIAAACNASGPSDLLLDLPGFGEDFGPTVTQLDECIQSYLDFFTSDALGTDGEPIGVIEKIRNNLLSNGLISILKGKTIEIPNHDKIGFGRVELAPIKAL